MDRWTVTCGSVCRTSLGRRTVFFLDRPCAWLRWRCCERSPNRLAMLVIESSLRGSSFTRGASPSSGYFAARSRISVAVHCRRGIVNPLFIIDLPRLPPGSEFQINLSHFRFFHSTCSIKDLYKNEHWTHQFCQMEKANVGTFGPRPCSPVVHPWRCTS